MLKFILVVCSLIVCCYCTENDVIEESRANKKRKDVVRLWAMILIFIFSKVAIFKIVSVVLLMSFFQKLFYLAGLFIPYFMKKPAEPPSTYGPPSQTQDYNTIGYNYGPPPAHPEPDAAFTAPHYGPPSQDASAAYHGWLTNKN